MNGLDSIVRGAVASLVFSIIGMLVFAAGWLRANWIAVFFFQLAGRLARYVVVGQGALAAAT